MQALSASFLMVVLGEMGDKTQLLAMALAGRFRTGQVMLGILVATVLNHGLAVVAGTYLAAFIPMTAVSAAAGLSFILFGLWTLRGDSLGDEARRQARYGPVITVAIAFFLAEMGDKTQLATVALAANYRSPLWVLGGTTAGMLVADAIGVAVGDLVSRKVSKNGMKLLSAAIFVAFGFLTLHKALAPGRLETLVITFLALFTAGAGAWLLKSELRAGKKDDQRAA